MQGKCGDGNQQVPPFVPREKSVVTDEAEERPEASAGEVRAHLILLFILLDEESSYSSSSYS
jgi:hypothetical protein